MTSLDRGKLKVVAAVAPRRSPTVRSRIARAIFGVLFSGVMVAVSRQVPSPSAAAWAIDLTHARGPIYVVLRCDESDARDALIAHLLDAGTVSSRPEAQDLVGDGSAGYVAVIW